MEVGYENHSAPEWKAWVFYHICAFSALIPDDINCLEISDGFSIALG